jgi:alkylation response protein AidB-like acyl-CoA dehydrogenase
VRLQYGEAEEAFRAELIGWLEANLPPREVLRVPKRSSADLPDWAREWQRKLFDAGWLVPGWPPELGGRNATPVQQMIYFEEMSAREIPRSLNPQGLGIISPSLKDHGTPEQIEQFLLPTLRAEIAWCLGMSEPTAGSDLASLRTRAVLDGDHFVVNGQKVWTSGAHHADWCLCFVRTDPDAPKHKGISALVIDMKSPGITCRPLPELTEPDFADFNEVFFSDVEVPAANLLGELHNGWRITQGSLAHERGMLWIGNAMGIERNLEALGRAAVDRGFVDDALFRDAYAAAYIDGQAMKLMGYRGFAETARGGTSPVQSVLKLFSSEIEKRIYLLGAESLGDAAIDMDIAGPNWNGWRAGAWAQQYLRSFSGTIAGGTSEIQRNIIAERVLGLPRT